MNKKLVIKLMEKVYTTGGYNISELEDIRNCKLSLAKVAFCFMLNKMNAYRVSISKAPLKVRIITLDDVDLDMMIDGNRFVLTGSEGSSYTEVRNSKEFNLVYTNTGSSIMLKLGERIGNKIFVSSEFMSILDNIWSTMLKLGESLANTVFTAISNKLNERLNKGIVDEYDKIPEPITEDDDTTKIEEEADEDMNSKADEILFREEHLLVRGDVATILSVTPSKISKALADHTLEAKYVPDVYGKGKGKNYISLPQLLKFTELTVKFDKSYPRILNVADVKFALRLTDIPILENMKVMTINELCQVLIALIAKYRIVSETPVIVEAPEPVDTTDVSDTPYTFDVNDMESREVVLANLFNKAGINLDNILTLLRRTLFTTREEQEVLSYMRGNICDIIRFMVPELSPILRMVTMEDDNGTLAPINYKAKIKTVYPTEESILGITTEKIEEILFPGVLKLSKFDGSFFLFVKSIYPNINPLRILNIPINDFTDDHIYGVITQLHSLVPYMIGGERASIFDVIGDWITIIENRMHTK